MYMRGGASVEFWTKRKLELELHSGDLVSG
jgi:hypothetical protein